MLDTAEVCGGKFSCLEPASRWVGLKFTSNYMIFVRFHRVGSVCIALPVSLLYWMLFSMLITEKKEPACHLFLYTQQIVPVTEIQTELNVFSMCLCFIYRANFLANIFWEKLTRV